MGRAPAYWSEENVKLIIDNFVPLSVHGADQRRQDAVGQFYRDAGLNLDKFEAVQCCVTAGGKVLEATYLGIDLQNTLEKWQALPESERALGAVKIANPGGVNIQPTESTPPAGGLILKVYTRAFMRDDAGQLCYVTGKNLWLDEAGNRTLESDYHNERTAAHQAQPDHMWLTEAEWKSLIPANPRKDDQFPMPTSITDRILRWHLNPLRFYGRYGPDALDRHTVRAGELTLTVEAVAPHAVRLRLDGFARLGQVPPAAVVERKIASLDQWGYEPRVLGFLEYEPQQQVFIRFDIVAMGEHFGRLGNGSAAPSRLGLQPLGMSFELVKGDQPADRILPGRAANAQSYFDVSN